MIIGATFHKCAFQVHSPRDPAYQHDSLDSLEQWEAFAQFFAGKCIEADLDAVAITDHHDLEFALLLRRVVTASAQLSGRLTIWPAMELTTAVPCQAIIIFDSEIPDQSLAQAYPALGILPPAQIPAPGNSTVTRLGAVNTLKDLYDRLDDVPALKGRYIVFPNVTEGGSASLMRHGFTVHYNSMPCVGGYTDGSALNFGPGHSKKLNGGDPAYGNKSIGVIQTNDSRACTVESLSEHPTWIKWAEPTAEALRQACLAKESRISLIEPELPVTWIAQIAVTTSQYLGTINLDFNPQLTALIGGRGTGKSTVLEYLAWCLCRKPESDPTLNSAKVQKSRDIIEQTLKRLKGIVAVDIIINGIKHTVRRDSSTSSVELRIADGPFAPATPEEIRELIPVSSYRQKQLSTLAVLPDEINTFVYAGVERVLSSLDQRLNDNLVTLINKYGLLIQLRTAKGELAILNSQLQSVQKRLEQIRKGLKGLTQSEQAELGTAPRLQEEEIIITEMRESLEEALTELRATYSRLDRWPSIDQQQLGTFPDKSEIATLIKEVRDGYKSEMSALKAFGVKLRQITEPSGLLDKQEKVLLRKIQSRRKRIANLQEKSKQGEVQLKQIEHLEGESKRLLEQKKRVDARIASLHGTDDAFQEAFDERCSLLAQRSEVIASEAMRIEKAANGNLRVIVGEAANWDAYLDTFKDAVKGSGLRANKFDEIRSKIEQENTRLQLWTYLTLDLDKLFSAKSSGIKAESHSLTVLRQWFSDTELEKIAQSLRLEHFSSLFATVPRDTVDLEYLTPSGEYIPFSAASAGQQASVLLTTLLGSPGPPLIIDQPEDDLDSAFISSLVERLWDAKQTRQLIFASHNANLVVNGDAELVIALETKSIAAGSVARILAEGAIDTPEVRRAITSIMEGGEKAFLMRKEKYGF
ncbi:MAG: hypothetical protein AKCLJLPJ_01898 [Fimbriimonadales bacterium]|nr:hypothetical protein [Fimbriimonadales bacterium]